MPILQNELLDRPDESRDMTSVPDAINAVASDSPSHVPGEALSGGMVSDRFELDTTPPVISDMKAGGAVSRKCKDLPCPPAFPVSFDAKDAASPIGHAEYSLDAGPWQYLEPVGKVSDSLVERYDFTVTVPAAIAPVVDAKEHVLAVRVYDRYENVVAVKAVVR